MEEAIPGWGINIINISSVQNVHRSKGNFELGYKGHLLKVPMTLPLKYFSNLSSPIPVRVQPWKEKLQIFKRDSFILGISNTGDGRDGRDGEAR